MFHTGLSAVNVDVFGVLLFWKWSDITVKKMFGETENGHTISVKGLLHEIMPTIPDATTYKDTHQ